MKPRLQADLQLEYQGHQFQLRSRSERGEELELVVPNLAAAAAAAKFGIQWGPGLAAQAEGFEAMLQLLPPIHVCFGNKSLMVLQPGRGPGLELVLKALQKLGGGR